MFCSLFVCLFSTEALAFQHQTLQQAGNVRWIQITVKLLRHACSTKCLNSKVAAGKKPACPVCMFAYLFVCLIAFQLKPSSRQKMCDRFKSQSSCSGTHAKIKSTLKLQQEKPVQWIQLTVKLLRLACSTKCLNREVAKGKKCAMGSTDSQTIAARMLNKMSQQRSCKRQKMCHGFN
jgi:hypothetical protein